ncbi:EAL domain-containing protein, partial [Salmonella enterica]|nr:EAL domain-containing protein [Salmonella enterica]EDE2512979.1 EAL domain-containing protein [Salmonella enterica]
MRKTEQWNSRVICQTLKENGAVPFFQPIHDIRTGKLTGAEILARLSLPDGSVVSPAAFLPYLNTLETISELTRTLLIHTEEWLRRIFLPEAFRLSFNIPADGLGLLWLADYCQAIVGGASSHITLVAELMETSPLSLEKLHLEHGLHRMREAGVLLALDDFGTGYSGFHLLQQTGADIIKIPREFIRSLNDCQVSHSIIDSVMLLAKTQKLDIIAEGVENQNQLSALQEKGVVSAQGYYYSQPLSAIDFSY